ncbi:hypothetical protein ACFHW2_25945 [Actinomadura sp. LOL_016]|uniref:hypothetical protein n=1 Tax=unclassified Actinomadura TaxID=2626254 RepID=UPI003A8041CD
MAGVLEPVIVCYRVMWWPVKTSRARKQVWRGGIEAVLGQDSSCLQEGEAVLADGACGHHELVDLLLGLGEQMLEGVPFVPWCGRGVAIASQWHRQYGTAILTESPILDWGRQPVSGSRDMSSVVCCGRASGGGTIRRRAGARVPGSSR